MYLFIKECRMKVSELIKKLTDVLVENWDLEVWTNFQDWITCYHKDSNRNIKDIDIDL